MDNITKQSIKQINTQLSSKVLSYIVLSLVCLISCLTLYADTPYNVSSRHKFEAGTKPVLGYLSKTEWKCQREVPVSVIEMQKKAGIGKNQEMHPITFNERGAYVHDSDGYNYNVVSVEKDFIASNGPIHFLLRSLRLFQDSQDNKDMLIIEESMPCSKLTESKCIGIPPITKVLALDDLIVTSYLTCLEATEKNLP